MVISERNDGGLIYVAETRNQSLINPLPPDLGKGHHRLFKGKSQRNFSHIKSTDSLKGKANESLITYETQRPFPQTYFEDDI